MLRIAVLLALLAGAPAHAQSMPPEMAKIFAKLQRGEALTEDEQRMLGRMAEGFGGPQGTGEPGPVTLNDLGVCPAQGTLAPSSAMDRSSYVALVGRLSEGAAARDPGAKAAIDALLATDPSAAEHAGVAAMLEGGTPAAVYATSRAATADPSDAMVANNLGVLLTGSRNYADAEAVLAYAATLEPDAPLIELNQGWNAYHAGATGLARDRFEEVLAKSPNLPGAQLGIGLLAACSGDTEKAVEEIRASLEQKRSKVAVMALAALAPDDPGPWRTDTPYDPADPIIGTDLQSSAALADAAEARKVALEDAHARWAARSTARMTQSRAAFEADGNAFDDNGMYDTVHTAYATAASDLAGEFEDDMAPLMGRWMKEGPLGDTEAYLGRIMACGGNETCQQSVEYQACRSYKELGTELHAQASVNIRTHWTRVEPAVQDLWAWSAGTLEHFHSPAWQELHAADLVHELQFYELQFAQQAAAWAMIAKSVQEMACTPPQPPPDTGPERPVDPTVGPGLCDLLQMTIKGGPFTFDIDCAKTTMTIDYPLQKFVFTSDVMSGEASVYWGIKGSRGKFSGEVGPYLTYNGTVTGAGIAGKGAVGIGGVGYEQGFRAGFAAIEGGPPYDYDTLFDTWGGRTGF